MQRLRLCLPLLLLASAASFLLLPSSPSAAAPWCRHRRNHLSSSPDPPPQENHLPRREPPAPQKKTLNSLLLSKSKPTPRTRPRILETVSRTLSTRPRPTDTERLARIEAARDLNGVSPLPVLLSGLSATVFGHFLYDSALTPLVTKYGSADWDASHGRVYALARMGGVAKTVVMGGISLLTFFTVIVGLGVTALGVRVGWGVWVTKELDGKGEQTGGTSWRGGG